MIVAKNNFANLRQTIFSVIIKSKQKYSTGFQCKRCNYTFYVAKFDKSKNYFKFCTLVTICASSSGSSRKSKTQQLKYWVGALKVPFYAQYVQLRPFCALTFSPKKLNRGDQLAEASATEPWMYRTMKYLKFLWRKHISVPFQHSRTERHMWVTV